MTFRKNWPYEEPSIPRDAQYKYNRKLYGGPPIHSNDDVVREFEHNNLRIEVCNYLKQKIEGEDRETQQYHRLEEDARTLTNGHIYLDVLFQAQDEEVKQLKILYDDLCGGR